MGTFVIVIIIIAILFYFSSFKVKDNKDKYIESKDKEPSKKENYNVDIQSMTLDSLYNIFEEKVGHKPSEDEKKNIRDILSNILNTQGEPSSSETYDEETLSLIRKEKIDNYSADMRTVVATFVDLKKEPYPYKIKKYLPLLKESHKRILEIMDDELYPEIVKCTKYDMFEGWNSLKGDDVNDYIYTYNNYSKNPLSLNIKEILDSMPERYKESIDLNIFDI